MQIKGFSKEDALSYLRKDPELTGSDILTLQRIVALTGSKKAIRRLRERYPQALQDPAKDL